MSLLSSYKGRLIKCLPPTNEYVWLHESSTHWKESVKLIGCAMKNDEVCIVVDCDEHTNMLQVLTVRGQVGWVRMADIMPA